MPKLSPLQWLIVVLFQVFYGFTVFAVTRDHYQRQPMSSAAPAPAVGHPGAVERVLGGAIPDQIAAGDPALLADLGDEHFVAKRYEEAIDLYRRALALDPTDVDTHNDLGLALHYTDQTGEALRVLKKGVERDPRFQRIWLTLGFVQMNSPERAEAKFALREAIALGADSEVGQEARRMLERLER